MFYETIHKSVTILLTFSAYVLPSVRESKFHTHTKKQENYSCVYLDILFLGGGGVGVDRKQEDKRFCTE